MVQFLQVSTIDLNCYNHRTGGGGRYLGLLVSMVDCELTGC